MKNPLVSIIVRTKNESFWIGKCLHEINNQIYKNYEVIVADNSSSDKTVSIIKKNFKKVKIIHYKSENFFPGKSLNLAISKSKGKFIAMISGHCIPKDKFWIKNLVKNFKDKKVAGVYGKQEPLDFSKPDDVRDLIYLFGKDKKVQTKDPFFHNANSMIRKDLWNKIKFDENTKHIEDRLWAQEQLNKNFKIIYEPSASVFHYHGVSHSENIQRVSRISSILTKKPNEEKAFKLVCLTAIQKPSKLADKYLIKTIINDLKKIKEIKEIFIICSDKILIKNIKDKNIIFINRGNELKKDYLGTDYVLKEIYKKYIKKKYKPSHILTFEDVYFLRPKNFFKTLIKNIDNNFDSLVPICKIKKNNLWQKNFEGKLVPIYKTSIPTSMTFNSIYQEIQGVGTITKSSCFENNGRESPNTKFFEIDANYALKINTFLSKNLKFNNE